jgi:hypothetical protein
MRSPEPLRGRASDGGVGQSTGLGVRLSGDEFTGAVRRAAEGAWIFNGMTAGVVSVARRSGADRAAVEAGAAVAADELHRLGVIRVFGDECFVGAALRTLAIELEVATQ